MNLTCPVCGYNKINEPKLKWSICPSCGTQFGLSDNGRTHGQLRRDWIDEGGTWQDDYIPKPLNWSPESQLRNIGYICTRADIEKMGLAEPSTVVLPREQHVTWVMRTDEKHYLANSNPSLSRFHNA